MIRMRFEGGQQLAANLLQLSPRVRRRTLIDALTEAGEPMRAGMAQRAPREPGAPDLAANMVISTVSASGLRRAGEAGDENQAAVAVGPSRGFFYGFFQEFGTIRHGAQPFARPAFDGNVQKTLDILRALLWTALAARGFSRTGTASGPVTGGPSGGTL